MARRSTLLSSTLSVTLIILFSKGIGFVREMIMAAYFGADFVTDAYNSGYSLFYIPVLLFSSCITSTLVPQYMRCRSELGQSGADRFSSNALTLFTLAALVISGLMFALARPLVHLVYPGFHGEKLALTVTLTRVMLPALVFFVAGLVLSSILNAREKYVAAQLTGLPLSIAEITAAVLLSRRFGIHAQAWGVIAAGVLQIVILVPFLRGDFKYRPVVAPDDAYLKRLLILALPAVLSMAVNELNHMVDRMLASSLNDGDITAMTYAFKLIMFMMGVLVVPLTTVSFSKMAMQSLKADPRSVIPQVRESMRLLIMAALPLVLICAVENQHLIRFAYGRGRFTDENVHVTGYVFLCYVVGVPFFGLRDLTNRVFHAFEDTKTPMYIAMISVAVNIVLNLILRTFMGVYGLALATGIAACTGVILLFAKLRKRISGIFDKGFIKEMLKLLAANLPMLAFTLFISHIMPDRYGTLSVFLRLSVITLLSLAVYALMLLLVDRRRASHLFRQLIHRIKR